MEGLVSEGFVGLFVVSQEGHWSWKENITQKALKYFDWKRRTLKEQSNGSLILAQRQFKKKIEILKGRYLALIITQNPRALYKKRKTNKQTQRIIILLYKREKNYPALKEESPDIPLPPLPQETGSEGKSLQLFSISS